MASKEFFQSGGAKSILDIFKMSILQKLSDGCQKSAIFRL
jgi:hypothetical protein